MSGKGNKALCGEFGGWNREFDRPCRNTAGKKTDHLGQGKCWLHGGRNGKNWLKHGRYSKVQHARVGELVEEFRNDPDWKKLQDEIALLRALLANYVNPEGADDPAELSMLRLETAEGLDTVVKLADSVSRMIERQERVLNGTTITMETLSRIMDCVAEAVRKRISDPEVIQQIQADWNAIAVMPKK